jgi:mono/diheme cytochrome c family protein
MRSALALWLFLPLTPALAEEGHSIVLERGPASETLELSTETLEVIERFDPQLSETRTFRGVPLTRLLGRHPGPKDADTIVLGFKNGMQIPLPLSSGAIESIDPFIAIESRRGRSEYSPSFPDITKKQSEIPDPRPIHFGGNKLVVAKTTHPRVKDAGEFSPWLYVDSLAFIRWVEGARYEAQFGAASDPTVARGREVFLARCQWCHGVAGHGARYGWDFVKPVPLESWRSTRSLHAHVKFRNGEAVERGYMMPPQRDVSTEEIEDLRRWMAAVSLKP